MHPTETVVSLSGNPYDETAVAAARAIKGYDDTRPFLCLVSDAAAARGLCARWPDEAERLARAFWPGPLTLVLAAAPAAPGAVQEAVRIALRPAADPVSSALVTAWGRALFSTSANRRGDPPPGEVEDALAGLVSAPGAEAIAIALVPAGGGDRGDAGAAPRTGRPSTIVDAGTAPPRLVRPGAISAAAIRRVVGALDVSR